MRDLTELDAWRVRDRKLLTRTNGWAGDGTCGAFIVSFHSVKLAVIASANEGWDHVSVSTLTRCPRWQEMEHIKRLFFKDDECAMQLHLPPAKHIDIHPFCLHMWRPHELVIPLPPPGFV